MWRPLAGAQSLAALGPKRVVSCWPKLYPEYDRPGSAETTPGTRQAVVYAQEHYHETIRKDNGSSVRASGRAKNLRGEILLGSISLSLKNSLLCIVLFGVLSGLIVNFLYLL